VIEFNVHLIVKDKIVSIDPVKTYKTGSMICDWDFGFTVRLDGNSIDILVPTERDGCGNHNLNQEERREVANNKRNELVKKVSL